jgi:hypothetical protein
VPLVPRISGVRYRIDQNAWYGEPKEGDREAWKGLPAAVSCLGRWGENTQKCAVGFKMKQVLIRAALDRPRPRNWNVGLSVVTVHVCSIAPRNGIGW